MSIDLDHVGVSRSVAARHEGAGMKADRPAVVPSVDYAAGGRLTSTPSRSSRCLS